MTKTQLLSGNEAIALAVNQAHAKVASAYPGTPSTEIMEIIGERYAGRVNAEWSVNEKVALEVAIGASIAGARAFCAMKHVGLNVAMDPLMTYTFIGTNGGLVLLVADDPHLHSSQNEQDTRVLARFAKAALLEPSDSQEAYDMTMAAFDISEKYGTPVLVRSVTRLSHSSSPVTYDDEPLAIEKKPYVKDITKTVAAPAFARVMRGTVEKRTALLLAASEASDLNRAEPGTDNTFGFVASSIAYQHVKEVFPEFPVLKLGFTNPLPIEKVKAFAATVQRLVVVEELDPVMTEQIRAAGISTVDFATPLSMLELTPARLLALRDELRVPRVGADLCVRPGAHTGAPLRDNPAPHFLTALKS
ncbi:MAG: hypothetical protein FWF84_04280 [Kiritimatiellaeota bacterium]|nr:hypothetical protein [Kiritimatiellota bacterium]